MESDYGQRENKAVCCFSYLLCDSKGTKVPCVKLFRWTLYCYILRLQQDLFPNVKVPIDSLCVVLFLVGELGKF
jgi:hypothetical protein